MCNVLIRITRQSKSFIMPCSYHMRCENFPWQVGCYHRRCVNSFYLSYWLYVYEGCTRGIRGSYTPYENNITEQGLSGIFCTARSSLLWVKKCTQYQFTNINSNHKNSITRYLPNLTEKMASM